jgi:hypothetical protein
MNSQNHHVTRIPYQAVVQKLRLLEQLSAFTPVMIGTPPLGIDVATSDIDVACYSKNLDYFEMQCTQAFGAISGYSSTRTTAQTIATSIVRFSSHDWAIEIFCQPSPVEQQWGVRHFRIEQRILKLAPRVAPMIREMKEGGLKTEPAFANLLGLKGDPYIALLDLENRTDETLRSALSLVPSGQ